MALIRSASGIVFFCLLLLSFGLALCTYSERKIN